MGRCSGFAQHDNRAYPATAIPPPSIMRVLFLIPVMFFWGRAFSGRLCVSKSSYSARCHLSWAKDLWQRQPHLGRLFVSFVSICRYWGVAKLPITNSAVMGSIGSQGRLGRLGKAQSDDYTRYTYYPYHPYYTYSPHSQMLRLRSAWQPRLPRPPQYPPHNKLRVLKIIPMIYREGVWEDTDDNDGESCAIDGVL